MRNCCINIFRNKIKTQADKYIIYIYLKYDDILYNVQEN